MDDYVEVELPDGSIVEFPSSMDNEAISGAIRKMLAPKKQESLLGQITRGPRNVGASVNKLAQNIVNIPSNVAGELGFPKASEALSFNKGFDIDKFWGLPEEKNWTDILAQSAPEIAAGMAVPGLALGKAGQALSKLPAGKYLEKIISEGIPQAGVAGLFAPSENRGEAAATAGITQAPFSALSQLAMSTKPEYQKIASILGGIGGGLLGGAGLNAAGAPDYISAPVGLALGTLGAKGLGTKGMMMQELAGGKNASLANERLGAANRIGLDFLTPSEAFNSPYLGRKQGRLGRTEEGSEMMYDKFHKRVESEAKAIDKVLNEIHNPDVMGPEAKRLYTEAYNVELPTEFADEFMQNDVVKEAVRDVTNKPAFQHALQDYSIDSLAFWDHVKQALDDMAEKAPKKEARIIKNIRNEMRDEMDLYSPAYKEARGLEERKIARATLEKAFDKTNINSGYAFYKALNSKEKFDKLMHNLRNVPEAQEKLKDMRELFKDFRDISTVKRVTGLEQTGMKQDRNDFAALKHAFENMFTKGKFDKEAIEFITSKDWDKQLEEINKITDRQKRMAKIIEVFGKGVAQASAKKEPWLITAEGQEIYD